MFWLMEGLTIERKGRVKDINGLLRVAFEKKSTIIAEKNPLEISN